MQYQQLPPISLDEAEPKLASDDPEEICETLVRLSLHPPKWRWVQNQLLDAAKSPHPSVRQVVGTCLGHLVRVEGTLDFQKVLPVLKKLMADPAAKGTAEDALEDIQMYRAKK